MRNFYVPEYSIMDFDFWDEKNVSTHIHQNVELVFLLEGTGVLAVNEDEIHMEKGDYCVINTNCRHGFHTRGEVLFVCLHINFNMLIRFVDLNRISFRCNSRTLKAETAEQIRKEMNRIINCYFAKTGTSQIKLNSYYYKLLNILVSDCVTYKDDERFLTRKQADQNRLNEIVNYVYSNYRSEISLNKLADQLYLSNTYLSKYIKNHIGMNLTNYVNNVRLYFALEEVLNTDKKMTHIALDNGFSNLTVFNKVFRQMYHMTPSEYREKHRRGEVETVEVNNSSGEVAPKIKNYLENNESGEMPNRSNEQYVFADTYEQQYITKYWNKMINVSRMSDLLMFDAQKHILELKKNLGFEYIRFWDIYAEELYLNIGDSGEQYNFARMDRIFDFLHENQIYPYIELGFKPILLVEKLDGYLREEIRPFIFETPEKYKNFLRIMLEHYVNRYGLEEVEKWYFEQWKDERLIDNENDYHRFFEIFEMVYHIIKSMSSKIKVGGGSMHHTYDARYYEDFISQWNSRLIYPDFLTLYSYPYGVGKGEGAVDRRRSQNPNFLRDQVMQIRDIQSKLGFHVSEIHVTEWNSSVSNRNGMNDSCYKGAYIMKNIIDNIGNIQILGYWLGSDLFSQYRDMNRVLSGGVGILSRDGIKKPAYFAFEFMNHLGMYILGKNENVLITSNGGDEYYIVAHNYKHPNYKYFALPENEVDVTNQEQYFEDWTQARQNFQIKHVRNGRYQIKLLRINMSQGSVLDEWIRLGMYNDLNVEEVNYLKNASHAKMEIWEQKIEDGIFNFETILEPNEIQHICLTYRF